MRNAEKFNPMKAREAINVSAGKHVSTKGHRTPKGGADSKLGSIAKGYLISGTGDTRASGGPFRKVSSAKMTKSSVKRGKG